MREGVLEAREQQELAKQGPIEVYHRALERRGFKSDASQLRAVERLQQLYEEWTAYKARRSTALRRLVVRPPLPRGVYLWGGVGRGRASSWTASTCACRWCASAACTSTISCATSTANWTNSRITRMRWRCSPSASPSAT